MAVAASREDYRTPIVTLQRRSYKKEDDRTFNENEDQVHRPIYFLDHPPDAVFEPLHAVDEELGSSDSKVYEKKLKSA